MSQQRAVAELLEQKQTKQYPLSEWYLGALRVLNNSSNPDRVAQAAHSLRELLEKLTRMDGGTDTIPSSIFFGLREKLYKRLSEDKNCYTEGWQGKKISEHLDETIEEFNYYLELNQKLNQKDKFGVVIVKNDPMFFQFDGLAQERKKNKLHELWKEFQDVSHHNKLGIEKELRKQLETLERILIDLFSPETEQDQKEIQSILKSSRRSKNDEEQMFSLIKKKGANYSLFFEKVNDPHWIPAIKAAGYLDQPPSEEIMRYLERVSETNPILAVDTIVNFKGINDTQCLRIVVDIAQKIKPIEQSLRLKNLVLKSLRHPHRLKASDRIAGVMKYWAGASAEATNAALRIMKGAVTFRPDPKWKEKQDRYRSDPNDWTALGLDVKPRLDWWIYDNILEEGVRPLIEIEPARTAQILIGATEKMVFFSNEDDSTIWCSRVHETEGDRKDSRKNLVHALTFACEKVYEKKMLESVLVLNDELEKQSQFIFARIRQHLYALYPNEQTKPWIREMILAYADYGKQVYHFEMQRMIRSVCESIGNNLLNREEKERIFEDILAGPLQEEFSEERKLYFHKMQLRPFASVLFGKYAEYFQKLEMRQEQLITDDDYMPYRPTGLKIVESISPKSAAELEKMTDDKLLSYLNEWDNVHSDSEKFWTNINFSGLAKEFRSLFKKAVLPDEMRLRFWMDNLEQICRSVYVHAMVLAMNDHVRLGKFDVLDQCFGLCKWVLSRPDQPMKAGVESPRQAVGDFVGMCLQDDVDIPISYRRHLASLLDKLCTQYDKRLDDDEPVFSDRDDLLNEAYNNTRSRALDNLVDFGYWARRQLEDAQAGASEVFNILAKRLDSQCAYPLTLPEYAILGSNYHLLFIWNQEWATRHKNGIFPQENPEAWSTAFGHYLNCNQPHKLMFDIVRNDIMFALDNMDRFNTKGFGNVDPIDSLGRHLTSYCFWGVYPLTGGDSLLENFYDKTGEDRWARLFDSTGRGLKCIDKQLDDILEQNIVAFAEWRLKKQNLSELNKFAFWMEAECLDEEWRLNSYSGILDTYGRLDIHKEELGGVELLYSEYVEVNILQQMVSRHTDLVVECFSKLINLIINNKKSHHHSLAHKAKSILQAGLASDNAGTRKKAKLAQEYLLRCGYSDLLDDTEG